MNDNLGPMLKCDPRAVRICFWAFYVLGAALVMALIARVWGVV